jgi:3-hydroxybutyryl-CoA dehydratase
MSLYFEDFLIGATYVSRTRVITEADVTSFSTLVGDVMRIHIDEEYARKSMFGGRIAQGALVLGIATGLFTQMNLINDTLLAFYAVSELRFLRPVFLNDAVQVEKRIVEVKELGPSKGLVTFDSRVFNQEGKDVIQFQDRHLIRRRTAN